MARLPVSAERDEFYVGYLPTPAGHARFLRVLVPALLAALLGGGAIIAAAQRDPGDAVWTTDETTTVEGRLVLDPYPRVVTELASVLLVESGKHGARRRATPLAGQRVRATGFPLARSGRMVLELTPGSDAITPLGDAQPEPPAGAAQSITLVGEIVDSKCYHGAMKPGDGKSHKACAILCIQGGIPPVLVVQSDVGNDAYLLASPDGGPIGDWLFPLVGEPVEIQGRLIDSAGSPTLEVSDGDIRLLK
jgi:hypothetical protein